MTAGAAIGAVVLVMSIIAALVLVEHRLRDGARGGDGRVADGTQADGGQIGGGRADGGQTGARPSPQPPPTDPLVVAMREHTGVATPAALHGVQPAGGASGPEPAVLARGRTSGRSATPRRRITRPATARPSTVTPSGRRANWVSRLEPRPDTDGGHRPPGNDGRRSAG